MVCEDLRNMDIHTFVVRGLHAVARYIERPSLIGVRRRGGMPILAQSLDQPWIHRLKLRTVLDIGANTGQFAITIKSVLPEAHVYAFEPLPECFAQLQLRLKDMREFTAFNLALGADTGTIAFERNNFTPSSSILKMSAAHKAAFPETRGSQPVNVKIECLDNVAEQLSIADGLLVKIDVQGYEDRVLRGGEQTIKRARLVIVETSFEPLYEGQPLFDDIYRLMVDWGFTYSGSLDQLCSPRDGRILQADSIFQKYH